jgi:hypothetical protein
VLPRGTDGGWDRDANGCAVDVNRVFGDDYRRVAEGLLGVEVAYISLAYSLRGASIGVVLTFGVIEGKALFLV